MNNPYDLVILEEFFWWVVVPIAIITCGWIVTGIYIYRRPHLWPMWLGKNSSHKGEEDFSSS